MSLPRDRLPLLYLHSSMRFYRYVLLRGRVLDMIRSVRYTFRFFLAFTLVAILVAIFSDSVFAATYYLNPATGDDGNLGTQSSPWKTMAKVKTTVAAGDTVNILAGTYTPSQYQGEGGLPLWSESHSLGRPGSPITIQANPGDTVTFDGQFQTYWMLFRAMAPYGGHYVVVQNLHFKNYNAVAIGVGTNSDFNTNHIAVINCTFDNFTYNESGALFAGSLGGAGFLIFRNNVITNIGAVVGDAFPSAQHCVYLSAGNNHVVFDGNTCDKISGYGVHGWGANSGVPSSYWIIRNNTLKNIRKSGIITSGMTFSNFYIYNNTFDSTSPAMPVVDATDTGSNIRFLAGGDTHDHFRILNNIGYGSLATANIEIPEPGFFTNSILDYNFWYNITTPTHNYAWGGASFAVSGFQSATGYEAHTLTGAPVFVNQTISDFHLQSSSPAVDSGTFLTTAVGSGNGISLT